MIGTLGHFNLLEEIGVGGLGRVYRARDTVHGRTVLIKVAPSELTEPGMRHDRFLASAAGGRRSVSPEPGGPFRHRRNR